MSGSISYSFGAFDLDPRSRELRAAGAPVRLTPKDVDVLLALVERRGEVVEKEAIFAAVWGGVVVEDCNLARHVANLRRALGDDSERPTFIETIPRRGYRFLAPVTCAAAPPPPAATPRPVEPEVAAPPPALSLTPPAATGSSPGTNPSLERAVHGHRRRLPRSLRELGRGALLLAGLVVLPSATWLVGHGNGAAAVVGAAAIGSVAVLPVANLTGDPGHDHLAEALLEMMVCDLGQLRGARAEPLRVLARSAANAYRGTAKTARQIAEELRVDGLLEASVLQADGRLRLTAELVDGRTGMVLWAQEVDGPTGAYMELQDDLVAGLAAYLGLRLGPTGLPMAGRQAGPAPGSPTALTEEVRSP